MPVWSIDSIEDRPDVTLRDWAAFEVPLHGPDLPWTRHLAGWSCEDQQGGGGGKGEPDIDRLSAIIKTFNDLFGNIEWKDEDKIRKVITEEIPARVAQDKAYQNAQANSDKQNAKLEHDKALNRVVLELLSDHTELFKQFSDNPNFKRWLTDMVFDATYHPRFIPPGGPPQPGASA